MSDEDGGSPRPTSIKSRLDDLIDRILSDHPLLVLPAVVIFALLALGTVGKSLVEVFVEVYKKWGAEGDVVAALIVLAVLIAVIQLVRVEIAPRPRIQPLPRYYLSRSPRIRWEYADDSAKPASYEVCVKVPGTGGTRTIRVPERMRQIELTGIAGAVEISVGALVASRKLRSSRAVSTEIYRDSVERIRETGKLRVAVHADPSEEVFCYYRDGKWQGFDIEFVRLIGGMLEKDPAILRPVEVEYSFYEWPAVIKAPSGHEVDMAIASISKTDERVRQYGINFSKPYAESKMGVVAYRRLFPGVQTGESVELDALKGMTVAVHNDTTALKFIEKAKEDNRYVDIQLRYAANNDELRELLRDNEVQAVVHDYRRAITLLDAGTVVCVLQHDIAIGKDEYGIVFSRVNAALLDKVDAIIESHKSDLDAMLLRHVDRKRQKIMSEARDAGPAIAQPRRPT